MTQAAPSSARAAPRRSPARPREAAAGALARRAVAAAFALVAVASGLHASWDLRAARAVQALARAEAAPGPRAEAAALDRADRALRGGAPTGALRDARATRALIGETPDFDAAREWSRGALRRSPARAPAFARLAYIDAAEDDQLDPEGLEALADAYLVAPFATDAFGRWRLSFTFSNWDAVDPAVRSAALSEASVAARVYADRAWLKELAPTLTPEARDALLQAVRR